MLSIFETCFNEKVINVLETYETPGKAVLLFNHGLGDFILFLPLFEQLCDYCEGWDLYIGCSPERNFKYLHKKCVIMDSPYGKYEGVYDIIFNIIYPEPPRDENELKNIKGRFSVEKVETITKPYLCNELEVGLPRFVWKPHKIRFKRKAVDSKIIGVHFFGHTSVQNKDSDVSTAEFIWNQIKEAGFKPFEIQMLPLSVLKDEETPKFIGKDTIRYQFPNLRIMCESIKKCKGFIGVDSGPIYLAGSILGFENVLGLERLRKFNKVCPVKMNILDIEDYRRGTEVIDFVKGLR
jgi:hypothetical protein